MPEQRPTVSVILPTYNRAAFLSEAVASIVGQSLQDWELVIVDDGSTDDTREVITRLTADLDRPVIYVRQENGGAYAARNTGLDRARGEYIAFFDSDDLWLPHHLARCAQALDDHRELDWVYGACRIVEHGSGRVIDESSFRPHNHPRPFLRLANRTINGLHIIDDPDIVRCQIEHGVYAGLQNSVMRRRVFNGRRFWVQYRVVEDALFLARALTEGLRVAYFDEPHVIYRVHEENSSASGPGSQEKQLAIYYELVNGYEQLSRETRLERRDRAALKRRLSREYFWALAYNGFWIRGQRREALQAFRRGLTLWPWNPTYWKTYLGAVVRTRAGLP